MHMYDFMNIMQRKRTCTYDKLCHFVCCSVLQCVAVCRSVINYVTLCVAVCCSVLQCVAVCCSVINSVTLCVAVCCSMLQGVAVCCGVINYVLQPHEQRAGIIHVRAATCTRRLLKIIGLFCKRDLHF